MCRCIGYISKLEMLVLNIFVASKCRLPLLFVGSSTLCGEGREEGLGPLGNQPCFVNCHTHSYARKNNHYSCHRNENSFNSSIALLQSMVRAFGSLQLSLTLAALAGLLIEGWYRRQHPIIVYFHEIFSTLTEMEKVVHISQHRYRV